MTSQLLNQSSHDSRIIVALDFAKESDALGLVDQLDPSACKLKVGLEMFTAFGAGFVRQLSARKFDIFLDLKFHDIPNTVAKACRQVAELDVWMTNVHALGGLSMMRAARRALDEVGAQTRLIAVTVLTSHAPADLVLTGVSGSLDTQVQRLALLTQEAGLNGIVCSAQEVHALRQNLPDSFCYVTPGIRPDWSVSNDQQRIMTPSQAVQQGASYLVIGRPITSALSPMQALAKIQAELIQAET